MKKLASYSSRVEAELLLSKLQQQGIHAVELDKKESVTQLIGKVEIHVSEDEFDRARAIMEDLIKDPDENA
jgi:hypothetical protein